jgi:beta-lactamase class A
MFFRKLLTIVMYTCLVLIIGRNMTFLPKLSSIYNPTTGYALTHLKEQTQSLIKKHPGQYSVYVADVKNPSLSFGINEHMVFTGASVNKVQIIAVLYYLAKTDMEHNKTSLTDMELLYRKIYSGQITSKALTHELLGFMRDTDNEDRLPKNLPDDAIVYHKTGDAIGNLHDVGIVSVNGQTYFIGVMTNDIGDNENETEETMATISKMVYDFMKNQG